MATYKVIQDIEAEDHILGPLTLRQFIFALIAVFFLYLCFICLTKGAGFLLVLFLPPALFFGFFAVPFGRDQPTEIWALAKIRFFLLPRKRIWDQSGVKELVTITVPKKVEHNLTNGLDQYEVQSRLKSLASTLDSRGWAVKNAGLVRSNQSVINDQENDTERLFDINTVPEEVNDYDVPASADILDEENGALSQQLDQMIHQSDDEHRQHLIDQMNGQSTPSNTQSQQWFMPTPIDNTQPAVAPINPPTVDPNEEKEILNNLKKHNRKDDLYSSHMRTLQPLSKQASNKNKLVKKEEKTSPPNPDIISLANNNNFTVDTIARQAKNSSDNKDNDEVVISLH